ncbi:MAG: 50S ribosomal protein L25 [Treponemataceae bacterium]|nr:50S ribosomal protein L25 [Treponemataceae bacterium]
MDYMTLSAEVRTEAGKKIAKQLRSEGKLPAVMYNSKGVSTMLSVDEAEFTKVWKQATPTTLIKLTVGKDTMLAFIKDTEYDIINDRNLHVDFHVIDEDKPLVAVIKLQLGGNPVGVREGGILQNGIPTIKIKCLPKDLPVRIIADISALKIGDFLHIKELTLGDGITVLSDGDAVVASVRAPKR